MRIAESSWAGHVAHQRLERREQRRAVQLQVAVATPPARVQAEAADDNPAALPVDPDALVIERLLGLEPGTARRLASHRRALAAAQAAPPPVPPPVSFEPSNPSRGPGFGLRVTVTDTRTTDEHLDLAVTGSVTTGAGQHLAFTAASSYQRQETVTMEAILTAGDPTLVDPLVIDLGGDGLAFAGRVAFDLDSDGREDDLASLARDDRFVALDHNRNGRIDDGRELFGPTTGDGFAELAALDSDGDGWIDGDDPAWGDLVLYHPGDGSSASLAAHGVGAIAINGFASPFDFSGGRLASTAPVLFEDGRASLVHHLDLRA